jgi:hypothetical protein
MATKKMLDKPGEVDVHIRDNTINVVSFCKIFNSDKASFSTYQVNANICV